MMSLAIIILLLMPSLANAHKEPAQGGVCHYFAKNKLHCHYNYRIDDLLLLPEEPPPITDEQANCVTTKRRNTRRGGKRTRRGGKKQEESVKDPLEERRKVAARQCLDALKQSCRRLSLGDACIWTARFSCEQTLLDAVPVADQKDIDDYITQEKHLWQEEVTPEEQDTDIVDDFFSLF